ILKSCSDIDIYVSVIGILKSCKTKKPVKHFPPAFKMSSKSLFESDDDAAQDNKLARKAKDSPFMLVGIAGFVAAGLIGAYKYKHRGTMSTSVFLMQLRVAAQGTVVGCLTVGLAYSMAKEYLFDKAPK
ncbi:hypothetical protein KR200_004482, partial [Drosophila serrata]